MISRKNSDVLQYWPVSNKKWWLDKKRNVGILLEYIISTKRFESSWHIIYIIIIIIIIFFFFFLFFF